MDQNKLKHFSSSDEKWRDFPPCALPIYFAKSVEEIQNLKIYEDDVFLVGYPRSGTTLLQEMVWLIVNDFDFEKAKSVITDLRFPLMESFYGVQRLFEGGVSKKLQDMTRPRTFKTHFPVNLLPDNIWRVQPKIIHVSREVKDVAISTYHMCKDFFNLNVELEQFLQDFLDDKVIYAPYREHCKNFLELQNYPNILFLTYEWVTSNLEAAIRRVAEFLGKEISNENLSKLMEHLQFDSMKSKFR